MLMFYQGIHNNPSNQSNNIRFLRNTKIPGMESNIQNLLIEVENNNENSNIDTPTSSVIIPPDLLEAFYN